MFLAIVAWDVGVWGSSGVSKWRFYLCTFAVDRVVGHTVIAYIRVRPCGLPAVHHGWCAWWHGICYSAAISGGRARGLNVTLR